MSEGESGAVLTPGAEVLAAQAGRELASAEVGLNHWLFALVERNGGMVERMAIGLDAGELKRSLPGVLGRGEYGELVGRDPVIEKAVARARAAGRDRASERDIARVVLGLASYEMAEGDSNPAGKAAVDPIAESSGQPSPSCSPPKREDPAIEAGSATYRYSPRQKARTPELDRYGRDLTREAAEGKLPPFVGRDREIGEIIETLCRMTKRNPVLIGDAGVGKTAIVEGLARRVVSGEVPQLIRGIRIIAVQPSSLVSGASYSGELEKRMKALLDEASRDGIVLFIDEVHSIVGAGGQKGATDVASLLKPALARGDLACIAATTGEEYRGFIQADAALERRFQPIVIGEFSAEQAFQVLLSARDHLQQQRGVRVEDEMLRWLVDFADRFLPHRHFPDKGIDLLEQCVARAATRDKTTLERSEAIQVAQELVGMPLDSDVRLSALRKRLDADALLMPEDAGKLADRLAVTIEGMDIRAGRPNAVVLMAGEARGRAAELACSIAEELFDSPGRVVSIDFGRFQHPSDMTLLLGAPPGYVGYSEPIALHRIEQMPWCVLLCENLHDCHPVFVSTLCQALESGFVTDARGRKIVLSEVVVLLTFDAHAEEKRRTLGFNPPAATSTDDLKPLLTARLGEAILSQVDLVCTRIPDTPVVRKSWVVKEALPEIAARFDRKGIQLEWDSSVADWLVARQSWGNRTTDWERAVDEQISPRLIRSIKAIEGNERKRVVVSMKGDDLVVETISTEKGE